MPSNRKKARRAVRAFLKNLSGKNPDTPTDQQGVWAFGAALYSEDLRTLLDSERAARRAAAVQSRKAAEAARVVAVLQQENTDLRNNVSELAKQVQTPPGGSERWQELRQRNTSLAAQLDAHAARIWKLSEALSRAYTGRDTDFKKMYETARAEAVEQRDRANRAEAVWLQQEIDRQAGLLRGAHKDAETLERLAASVPDLRRLVEERGRKIRELTAEQDRWQRTAESRDADLRTLTAERDAARSALAQCRDNEASLRRELDAPRTGLSAEDIRKVAEDLLPQFLETFLKGGKK